MLTYLFADQLHTRPELAQSMFRDRADQFRNRLGWDVEVHNGEERDEYDDMNPLYAIWETEEGLHGGSMRFLPTNRRTMINDHFSHLLEGRPLRNAGIWESTRFCLARGAKPNVSAGLMLGAAEIGLGLGLDFTVGVFDARMVRIYSRLGVPPAIIGAEGEGRDAINVGLWYFTEYKANKLAEKSGEPRARSRTRFNMALEQCRPVEAALMVVA